jgi:cobalt-zinc-cadmium efflux system membrane fusion protein
MDKKKWLFALGAAALFVLAMAGRSLFLSVSEEEEHHEEEARVIIVLGHAEAEEAGIVVLQAGPYTLVHASSLRGKVFLEPEHQGAILTNVAGVVKEAKKYRGDAVKPREVVAILESREVADAKASFLAALEREKCLGTLFEGEAELQQKGISSKQEFLLAQYDLEEARINLKLARQKLLALGLLLDDIENLKNGNEQQQEQDIRLFNVRAPREGVIVARNFSLGEYVDEAAPLYEIADLRKASVAMSIYPKDLEQLKVGQSVEVESLQGGQKGAARISYISPFVEETSMACKGIALLDNGNRQWRPGSYVKIYAKTPIRTVAVAVEKGGIQIIEGRPYVFVKTPEGFVKKEVVLGDEDGYYAEVISGIEAGEPYAAGNTFLLKADLSKDSLEHEG